MRQVGAAAVGEHDGDERLGVVDLGRDLQRGVDRHAARAAGQDALGHRQAAGGQEGVAVGDRDVAVDDLGIERRGPEVLAHALDQVRPHLGRGVDRALRVGADDLQVRDALLEVAPGAGDRAAGADADDQVRETPAGLLVELGAGRLVVGLRVGRVEVLVGLEGARDLRGQALGHGVVGLGRVGRDGGRRDDDLGPVGAQQVDLLLGHLVGHDRDDRGSPSGARRWPGRCRCCPRSARRSCRRGAGARRARPRRSSRPRRGP